MERDVIDKILSNVYIEADFPLTKIYTRYLKNMILHHLEYLQFLLDSKVVNRFNNLEGKSM